MVLDKWLSLLAAAGFALSLAAVTGRGESETSANIAPNPSAEQVDKRERPVGWGHYENTPDQWGATDEEFHTGKRSAFLKITGFGDDDCACTGLAVGRTDGYSGPEAIPVDPNTTYHFAFSIAGYGVRRNITVKPWGFKADGSGRDRGIEGISLVPTPEWQRYAGSFMTPPGIERVALMFFVYGLHDRDVEEGATFYVDDVYLGTEPPPPPVPATSRKSVTVPNRAKMLLDLIMDDDTIWVLTSRKLPEGRQFEHRPTRFSAGNAAGGWHAGWSRIGEGDCDRVWTAPFIQFAGQPV